MLKEEVDEYLKLNIKDLKKVASNIIKNKNIEDILVSDLIIHLYDNHNKLEYKRVRGYCITWIGNNFKWSRSPFNYDRSKYSTEFDQEVITLPDNMSDVDIDNDGMFKNEYDYYVEIYGEVKATYLYTLQDKYNSLPKHLQILFDMHFMEGLSYRKIAKRIRCSSNTISKMVKILKEKIK